MTKGYLNFSKLKKIGFKKLGRNVLISKKVSFINPKNISIGSNVRIDDYTIIIAIRGTIIIKDNIHIGSFCYLNGSENLFLGNYCNLSQGVKIYTKSDNYDGSTITNPTFKEKYTKPIKGKVYLDEHCIIGPGTVILPGVTLEKGVSVGALSLIKKNLKKWNVYAGIPVKKIKKRKIITKKMEHVALNEK